MNFRIIVMAVVLMMAFTACAGSKEAKQAEKLDYFATMEKEALAQLSEQSPGNRSKSPPSKLGGISKVFY